MAEDISPERMQRLMELSNNAMTVELGALRNPQVTTVPSNEPNAFYQTAPSYERAVNDLLYVQYRIIDNASDVLKFNANTPAQKESLKEEVKAAEKEIEKIKSAPENVIVAYVNRLQQEKLQSVKDDMYGNFSELDQARDQIVISEGATDSVLAHEIGHGAFSAAKDFFLQKVAELGSKEAAFVAVSLEYGRDVAENIRSVVDQAAAIGFADENEGTVQYYDNPLSDDPENPGVGTATFEGGETYYTPGGGFEGPYDRPRPVSTDLLLQKPFTDYRTGEVVYHDEYKGGEGDFEADMKKAGLGGFETLMSDLIAKERELDPMSERKRRRLKINPLGAPEGEVLRSVRPKFRPENFAQGGPVMNGIGTLNETARNMFRGPSGVGTYQQFASGGEAMGPLNMPYGSGQGYMPYGLSNQQAYQPSQLGMGGMQQGNGINQYSQYLEKTYGNPEFDQKRDNFLNNVQQQEQQTFGGMDGGMNPFDIYQQPMRQSGPTPQGIGAFPFDLYQQQSRPTPQGSGRQDGIGDFPKFSDDNVRGFGPEQAFLYAQGGLPPNEMQLFASGGEAMGPPPTRGPDPQGIGAFQKFADGGPVYMQEGGDPFAEVDFDKLTAAVIQTESAGDPNAVSEDDAIGLMQVLPSTGAQPGYEQLGAQNVFDIAIDLGFPIDDSERTVEKSRELLFDPEVNVAFGTKYLRAMIAHSGGDIKRALQKYNTGTGNYQAFVEGRKPLDQEAVRYPVLVANALTGGNLAMPEAAPMGQVGPQSAPFISSKDSDFEPMLGTDYRTPPPPETPLAVEKLMEQSYEEGLASPRQRDTTGLFDDYLKRREQYMKEDEELVRPKFRPPELEILDEDIDGLTRSLRPRLRPEPVQPYGGSRPGSLMYQLNEMGIANPELHKKIMEQRYTAERDA